MTSSTRIRARSFGSRPDRMRLLITLSEIEPTGWPLCMTGIGANFQRLISFTAASSGIFASTYWPLRPWIWSTSAFFSCRFSSAWRAFMIRFTLSYDGFICRFSIFTIVDWLTFARRAIAVCVSPSALRSRGISSRSGIIGLREGLEVHIPVGIFDSIRYYPQVRSREGLRRHVRHPFPPSREPGRQKPYMERDIHAPHPSEDFRGAEHL